MQDITHKNFEAELVNASLAQPVLLDIWAPWCGPCKTLGPVLEKLETAYAGRFKLVKLNADEEPEIAQQLSQMFGVRSIPFCVMFKGGQPVDGFVGALPEPELRRFLDKHVPSEDEVAALGDMAEAEELLEEGDTDSAIDKLQAALATNPANDTARHDYIRALILAGRIAEARKAFDPVANNPVLDARLVADGHWIAAHEAAPTARKPEALAAAIAADKRDFDARFELAQLHFARGEFTQAMDELLEIIMRDKTWKDELARKTYVAILQQMTKPAPAPGKGDAAAPKQGALEIAGRMAATPSDPVVDAYRRKLSMALF
ncbi:MAG TPA: tetratricopeptide repeat protein [Caldimonas sp.]|jgi:putative thioredoxin|nr:tetratricopeptide repeat protein [Caldimonas sp.]HEX2542864.1 tetratricopeptide repeat protein [Caldimonas sp.]